MKRVRALFFIGMATLPIKVKAELAYLPVHVEKLLAEAEKEVPDFSASPLTARCFASPHNSYAIGVVHAVKIEASLGRLKQVFEDFERYRAFLPGLSRVESSGNLDSGEASVKFFQPIPLFFASDTQFTLSYRRSMQKDQIVYRMDLKESPDLTESKGFGLLRGLGPKSTLYVEGDFWSAKWGAAKVLGPQTLWTDALKDTLAGDWALKFRVESTTTPDLEIKKKATQMNDRDLIEKCYKERISPDGSVVNP